MPDLFERLREAVAPRYELERELATGGMGTVFLARDAKLDCSVAIKILRPELATAQAVERFVREARTLAQVRHPNVVPIHDVDARSGFYLYVMDYLGGETLADRLARGPLPPAEATKLARELLEALKTVHRRGVVHRDIKPNNIFLVDGRAVLTDFGVAKSTSDARTALTVPGAQVGTPGYMSPEQMAGGEVTASSDLYAVAQVLYEALTGRRWEAFGPAGDWAAVPRSLLRALRRGLALSPQDHWPDAAAFDRALWARRPVAVVRWAAVAGVGVAAAYVMLRWLCEPLGLWRVGLCLPSAVADLAIQPFQATAPADRLLGEDLAFLAANNLEGFQGLRVVPANVVLRGSRPSAHHRVDGRIARRGDSVAVQLVVRGEGDGPGRTAESRGLATDKWRLGNDVAFAIARLLEKLPPGPDSTLSRNLQALDEFLNGERAFRQDLWREAEIHFQRAHALDTTFARALWRMDNAQRWRRVPRTTDLRWLLARHGARLRPLDRLLIGAELAPVGSPRHATYLAAIDSNPYDPYPPLLYGSELFHRGPLSGVPLDSSAALLAQAVQLDSALAPALDQLVWVRIRLGRCPAADTALGRLRRVSRQPSESDMDLPGLLEVAYGARCTPAAAGAQSRTLPPGVFRAVRFALAFDLPATQLALGAAHAAAPGVDRAGRASAHTAQGVALVALGRPAQALGHFDSAAVLFGTPVAALQAAQWRVLLPALAVPGIPPDEVARGRALLSGFAAHVAVGARAAWSLAVDAYGAGDTGGGRSWAARVGAGRLGALEQALGEGARGRYRAALERSAPLLATDEWHELGDPFARAVLHLKRAEWLDSLALPDSAERERRWHENSDFEGWLDSEAQAAEIDWALGVWARWRQGMNALAVGDRRRGCEHLRRVAELWTRPQPALAPLAAQAAERCSA